MNQPPTAGGVPPARPQPGVECPICHGEGYLDTPDFRKKPCVCRIRQRVRDYLTPTFAEALWVKPKDGFDTARLDGRNVLIQNNLKLPDSSFNRLYHIAVKSFLLNHNMSLGFHNCLGAKEVVDCAFFENDEERDRLRRMETVDLLLLYLAGDPPNKTYSQVLTGLLRQRGVRGCLTWVVTPYSLIPDDRHLDAVYGSEFVDYIKPRQRNDAAGKGAGNFLLFDPSPIVAALTPAKAH